MPTITAIIPTYNRAHFIGKAIDCVLAQSRQVDEIIVVDDGSTDNTREVLKPYQDSVRYLRQNNSGPGAARNLGLREAKGDLIALLDSDDTWVQDRIRLQLELLKKHPEIGIVFGDEALIWSDDDRSVPYIKNPIIHQYLRAQATSLDRILDCLIQVNVIPTSSAMIKRDCVDKIGFFNEKYRWCEDLDYWLRAACCCRFGFIDAVLVRRKRHDGNLVNDWVGWNTALIEVLTNFSRILPNIHKESQDLIADKLFETNYDLGSYFFKKKDFVSAFMHLRKGVPAKLANHKWMVKLVLSFLLKYLLHEQDQAVKNGGADISKSHLRGRQ